MFLNIHPIILTQTQGGSTMKKNNANTKTNDVTHVNTIHIQGTVSHIKSYKTKDGKDLVKGLIKSQGEHGFVSVPFTIWDASNGIPEDDDTLDLHGMLATSSYEKDGHKVYNTYVSVDNYSD